MEISFNTLDHDHCRHTLGCGQPATEATERLHRPSFSVNAIDDINGVEVVDTWQW